MIPVKALVTQSPDGTKLLLLFLLSTRLEPGRIHEVVSGMVAQACIAGNLDCDYSVSFKGEETLIRLAFS